MLQENIPLIFFGAGQITVPTSDSAYCLSQFTHIACITLFFFSQPTTPWLEIYFVTLKREVELMACFG